MLSQSTIDNEETKSQPPHVKQLTTCEDKTQGTMLLVGEGNNLKMNVTSLLLLCIKKLHPLGCILQIVDAFIFFPTNY